MYEVLDKKYPNTIKIFGFGPDNLSLEDFKKRNLFPHSVFIPKEGKKFYDRFQFDNPGILKCFGYCNKNILKRYDEATKQDPGYTFKGSFSQLGGSFIINSKGKVIYSHFDRYLGDNCPKEEIFEKFETLIGKYFEKNIEELLDSPIRKISKKNNKDSILNESSLEDNQNFELANREIDKDKANDEQNNNQILKLKQTELDKDSSSFNSRSSKEKEISEKNIFSPSSDNVEEVKNYESESSQLK